MTEKQENQEVIDQFLMMILWDLVERELLSEKEAILAKKIYLKETRDQGQKK